MSSKQTKEENKYCVRIQDLDNEGNLLLGFITESKAKRMLQVFEDEQSLPVEVGKVELSLEELKYIQEIIEEESETYNLEVSDGPHFGVIKNIKRILLKLQSMIKESK